MKKLSCIVTKELKCIFRDRSTLITLIIPVLIIPILMFGLNYISNTSSFDSKLIKTTICTNCTTKDLVEYSKEKGIVLKYSKNPVNQIKSNKADFAILYSKNNYTFVFNNNKFFSLIKAANNGSEFEKYVQEKDTQNTSCKFNIVNQNGIYENVYSTLNKIIVPIFLTLTLLQASGVFANDMFAGERERKTLEMLFSSNCKKKYIYYGKAIVLLIIELFNLSTCMLSYIISTNKFNNIVFSTNHFLLVFLFLIVFCISNAITELSISLFSSTYRASQLFNELFLSIISILTIVVSINGISYNIINFVPLLNVSNIVILVFKGMSVSGLKIIEIIVSNLLYSIIVAKISVKHMHLKQI